MAERRVDLLTLDSPVAAAALEAFDRGWMPLVLMPGEKRPIEEQWPRATYSSRDGLADYLTHRGIVADCNLGVRLGDGGLTDVDLDDALAVRVAPRLLPPTPAISGRESSPRSHWWYVVETGVPYVKRSLGDGTTIVELRGTRAQQTAVPPSVHPSGEVVRWQGGEAWGGSDGPARVEAEALRDAVDDVALVVALVYGWPTKGDRHLAYLDLAGALLRHWPQERVIRIIDTVAWALGDEEGRVRARQAIPSTLKKLQAGSEPVTGWTALSSRMTTPDGVSLGREITGPDPTTAGPTSAQVDSDEDTVLGGWQDMAEFGDPAYRPKIVMPNLLKRVDSMCLIYEAVANLIYGAPESGKSWIAMSAVVEKAQKDKAARIWWVDIDDVGRVDVGNRLRWLGMPLESFASHQFRFSTPGDGADINELLRVAAIESERPSLVVLDAFGGLMAIVGQGDAPSNSPDAVRKAWKALISKLVKLGITVIVIDHTTKDGNVKYGPEGAGSKKQLVRGSMIGVTASDTPPVPGGKGHVNLWLFKDFHGSLRADTLARGVSKDGNAWRFGRFELECLTPDRPDADGSLRWKAYAPNADGAHDVASSTVHHGDSADGIISGVVTAKTAPDDEAFALVQWVVGESGTWLNRLHDRTGIGKETLKKWIEKAEGSGYLETGECSRDGRHCQTCEDRAWKPNYAREHLYPTSGGEAWVQAKEAEARRRAEAMSAD
ncbi:bifunctional DNA primase/polymerase [Microbacterium sp. AZCO]|uniref:bifunctional DNA primase/polymerase n=1 Tax=Microbacterium sp. AZCO TaxID=3142976 RepID=UPI0031F35B11